MVNSSSLSNISFIPFTRFTSPSIVSSYATASLASILNSEVTAVSTSLKALAAASAFLLTALFLGELHSLSSYFLYSTYRLATCPQLSTVDFKDSTSLPLFSVATP